MKMKSLTVAALMIPLALGSASAMAYGGGKNSHNGHGDMNHKMLRQLDLTDEQEDQIKEIIKTQREAQRTQLEEQRDSMMAEMQQAKTTELELVLSPDFDEAQAEVFAAEMVQKHQSRYVEKLRMQHEVYSVLTDEQKAELQTLQAERMAEMAEKEGRGGKGGKKGW